MSRHRLTLLAAGLLVVVACSPSATPTGSQTAGRTTTPTPSPIAMPTPTSSPGPSPASSPSAGAFDPAAVKLAIDVVVDGLDAPLDVANAGDGTGRLFVAEQGGQIRIVRDGALVAKPFLDLGNRISSGGERGLLGLTFHPDYPTDPRFFVDYTDPDGNTVVASYTVSSTNPDVADPGSETVLLHIKQPYPNHNGGAVEFGPDGMLYIGMGDGGSGGDPQGNGQRVDTLLGKVLRIDVDAGSGPAKPYGIPPGNPLASVAGARPEIWLIGLRNPWRFRFDKATGDLWIGDVGQNAWEEIDVARAGAGGLNFGWNTMEGFHCFEPSSGCRQTDLTLPVAEYGHSLGCAVIGGVVVRDPRQGALDGGYLFGDACSDNVWVMDPVGDGKREPTLVKKAGRTLSAIGEGEDGTVYATSLSNGELLRISQAGS